MNCTRYNFSTKIEYPHFQGLEFLKKSCEMNNATACFYLSGMHISGIEKADVEANVPAKLQRDIESPEYIVAKDMEKAFTFAYKACELKNMYACANLSQMYARGEGTKQNDEKAEKYKKIALAMQDEFKAQKTLQFQQ